MLRDNGFKPNNCGNCLLVLGAAAIVHTGNPRDQQDSSQGAFSDESFGKFRISLNYQEQGHAPERIMKSTINDFELHEKRETRNDGQETRQKTGVGPLPTRAPTPNPT